MGEQGRGSSRWWLRWNIGVLMIAVAAFATAFSLLRQPSRESVATEIAADLLKQYQPGFDANKYRADEITESADSHFWRVHFTKVEDSGEADTEATVPVWR